jgi:Na+/H+-dicarboxylate symporter
VTEHEAPPAGRRRRISITTGSVIGLLVGVATGIALHGSQAPLVNDLASGVEAIGLLWANALRMTVIPLVVSQLVVAIAAARDIRTAGRLTGASLLSFVILLTTAAVFTVLVVPPIISAISVNPETIATLAESAAVAEGGAPPIKPPPASFATWLSRLIPENPIRAAADSDLLPLLIFVLPFALAITHARPEPRKVLVQVFQAVADAMMVLVRWILVVTPFGVFALAFTIAQKAGVGTATVIAYFIALVSAAIFAFTLALYPIAVVLGRVPLRRFAAAVAPAQMVAIGTRSSIATLPAMLASAKRLALPAGVAGLVLPLSVSAFKVNRTISAPVKLLFIAHVYGIDLGPAAIATFVVTALLLSFATPGIPEGGPPLTTLPAYLAAGLPLEGILLFSAVAAIPDIFKTLCNVTGDMTVATVLARLVRLPDPPAPDPVEAG